MQGSLTLSVLIAVLGACQSATQGEGESLPADDAAELAKKLSNPVAALISVPIQGNVDTGIGPKGEDRTTINIQPVVPFSIGPDWNLITRTIVPFIQADVPQGGGGEEKTGLGDITESLFFSPVRPTASGWIWGVGPVLLMSTASDHELGSEKWAAGPTVVVLKQADGWTYGALANHLWSFAGESSRTDIEATFLQPFVTYTTPGHTTLGLNTESVYDWEDGRWTIPVNLSVSQLVTLGGQPLSFGAGFRQYAEVPAGGPDWGLRLTLTLLFPR